ncbi:MAG: TnsA endonuclease N-terminal domain-containing protein [Blastocatellia bacterium]|nr:TnsA endonuclease N-terminal domain-containing protein [Blastocatellia bacterium]
MTGFESGLERDFLFLLEFDPAVVSFEEQPVTIFYTGPSGILRRYTPDVLVSYAGNQPSELCEIKYLKDLKENRGEFCPKFRAAQQYAIKEGWRFRIVTERKIRGIRLNNVKFLLPYRNLEFAPEQLQMVSKTIQQCEITGTAGIERVLDRLAESRTRQAELLPVIWHLLAVGLIQTDLNQPLRMTSILDAGM